MRYREGQDVEVGDMCRARTPGGLDVAGVVYATYHTVAGESMDVVVHRPVSIVKGLGDSRLMHFAIQRVLCPPGDSTLIARHTLPVVQHEEPVAAVEPPAAVGVPSPTAGTTPVDTGSAGDPPAKEPAAEAPPAAETPPDTTTGLPARDGASASSAPAIETPSTVTPPPDGGTAPPAEPSAAAPSAAAEPEGAPPAENKD